MRKYILCMLVLALIATIGFATKAVGQSDRECVNLWKACYSGDCNSLRLLQEKGHCLYPAGDYFIGKDEYGLYISTDRYGKYDIISEEIAPSIKPGTQGIYFIKKNKSGNYISTDRLGDIYIEPERISKKEARESARQKAEWDEMWEDTARRDIRVTKARRLKEAQDRDEEAREEAAAAREEAQREFLREIEADRRKHEREMLEEQKKARRRPVIVITPNGATVGVPVGQ